jgi:hypothetical protein
MANSKDTPKVFISYSWNPIINKEKTIELAQRLSNDGVHVILDEWDLAEGQDKYQFMEQMVNNPDIKRVLLICNKDYSEKANKKKGGVGIESLIISDEIYKKVDQTKFVPVIFEKDPENQPYMPIFIKTRIYIDLSNEIEFEEQYEVLLRNIFDKPKSKRPPIGTPPAFIEDSDPVFLRTSNKVQTIKNALINEKKNYQIFIDDYYTSFISALNDFEISDKELSKVVNIDENVLEKIEQLKVLRNDFIEFLETVLSYSYEFNNEKFFSFFEKLVEYFNSKHTNNYQSKHYGSLRYDNFRFFYYELFLYTVTIMWEKEKYNELGYLLHNNFIIYDNSYSETKSCSFLYFNLYTESLNKLRNTRLQMNRISVSADLVKQRADIPKYPFIKLMEFDAILYYIAIMDNEENNFTWLRWFPHTTVYDINIIPNLKKLESLRFFQKVKPVFNTDSVEDLKAKVNKTINIMADKVNRFDYQLPDIGSAFNLNKIGTIK